MATELMLGVWTTPVILWNVLDDVDVSDGADGPVPDPVGCEISMVTGSDSGSGSGVRVASLRLISMNIVLYIDKSCSDNLSMGFPVKQRVRYDW